MKLGGDFFARSALEVARDLIGCEVVCDGVGGVIVETESYREDDPACHAYSGMTKRNRVLFGRPGSVYVYLSYGIHNMLNFVAEEEGTAAAVLIRALEPTVGVEKMAERRSLDSHIELCSGPGKLTQALGITLADNGSDLSNGRFAARSRTEKWFSPKIARGPRIGISKGQDRPWRFFAAENAHVSSR